MGWAEGGHEAGRVARSGALVRRDAGPQGAAPQDKGVVGRRASWPLPLLAATERPGAGTAGLAAGGGFAAEGAAEAAAEIVGAHLVQSGLAGAGGRQVGGRVVGEAGAVRKAVVAGRAGAAAPLGL